jgi:hypothetical protein
MTDTGAFPRATAQALDSAPSSPAASGSTVLAEARLGQVRREHPGILLEPLIAGSS